MIDLYETARVHYLDLIGVPTLPSESNRGALLEEIKLRFLAQVTYPDHVWLHIRTKSLGESSIVFEMAIVRLLFFLLPTALLYFL